VISLKSYPERKRRPGDVGRYWMVGTTSGSLEELDPLALAQRDVRLLPSGAATRVAADPAHLPEMLGGAHLEDLHLEELLDRLAHLDLVRIRMHAEHDLVARLVHERALFRDDRALHDVDELHAAPPRRRTIPSMASRVTINVGCPSTSYTLS